MDVPNPLGHSLGADAALEIAATDGIYIDHLVTVDPVGWTKPDLNAVKNNTGNWTNINATPTNGNFSDAVAAVGGKYGTLPEGSADSSYNVSTNHGDFAGMMQATPPNGGSSAEQAAMASAGNGPSIGPKNNPIPGSSYVSPPAPVNNYAFSQGSQAAQNLAQNAQANKPTSQIRIVTTSSRRNRNWRKCKITAQILSLHPCVGLGVGSVNGVSH